MATYSYDPRQDRFQVEGIDQRERTRHFAFRRSPGGRGLLGRVAKVLAVVALVGLGLFALSLAVGVALVLTVVLALRGKRVSHRARHFTAGRKFPDTVS